MFVFTFNISYVKEKKEPAQVVEPRETVDVPLSFGDNVVMRTSCQHLMQHL